ncbi:Inner membrane protein ybjM [Raoultella planticola]|uniref:Inner membrane protein ybjM n=1 Tax=Raoultella planticola TaxID=575 RepID=A0A485CDB7_RAOPL|nr:Inner membrane protein ybjM [Raoultella planticola]
MKSERAWVGITCGFFLFIVVCLLLLLHMKGVFRATGNPEVGLLYFLLPGAAASCLSPGRRVIQPLVGGDSGDSRLSADHADFFCGSAYLLATTGVAV